jgi:N-methylhydantoinase A
VIVPEAAGVLSALGLVAADERRDQVRSFLCPLREAGELPREGEADLRYRGQSFELTLPLQPELEPAFHRAHAEQYGFADPERTIELVAVRTADVRPAPRFQLPTGERRVAAGPVRIDLDGATLWIPPGWVGARDGATWIVTRV